MQEHKMDQVVDPVRPLCHLQEYQHALAGYVYSCREPVNVIEKQENQPQASMKRL